MQLRRSTSTKKSKSARSSTKAAFPDSGAVTLLSRPQDKFFNRVAEIERLAKQAEKDIEKEANQ